MIPFKVLSWSILLTLPVVAVGLMIGYFGFIAQGPDASSFPHKAHLSSSFLNSIDLYGVAYAQDEKDEDDNVVDVSVGQTLFPNGQLLPSQPIVYSLFITNNSSALLSGIVVSSIVPGEIVSTTIVNTENGSTITELSGYPNYKWQIDNLAADTKADIYVLGRLAANLNQSTSIENKLSVVVEGDSDPSNNSSTIRSELSVPTISFAAKEIVFTETPTQVSVPILLNPVNPYGSTQVDYGTANKLTASNIGSLPDFETVSGTLSFEAAVQSHKAISITLFDDKIDGGNESFQLFLSNPRGASLSQGEYITITIADNDEAGLNVSPPLLSLAEGGATSEYNLTLESQPTSSVVVSLSPSAQILASPSAVTFTSSTWDTPQVISVVAVDDIIAEGLHNGLVAHSITSLDQKYEALEASNVTAGIVDNERATFSVSTATLTVTEGVNGVEANTYYSVSLDSEPSEAVTVSIEVEEPLQAEPSILYFTPESWDEMQPVIIFSLDDSLVIDSVNPVRHRIISSDPAYSKASIDDIPLTYIDNDRPGLMLPTGDSAFQIMEGRVLEYDIALNTAPESPVTIDLRGDSAQVTIEPASVTFDSTNWNQPQQVRIKPIDDDIVEGTHNSMIEHDPQSADLNYGELISKRIVLNIIDNDILLYLPYVQRE